MKNIRFIWCGLLKSTSFTILASLSSLAIAQNVLFEGPTELPFIPADPPASDAGTRMMWYPDKASFRAGSVTGTEWNKDSIGPHSVAFGSNNTVSGNVSSAFGVTNRISSSNSMAWGLSNRLSGAGLSTVWGSFNFTDNYNTTVWGVENKARGMGSTVFGEYNVGKSLNEVVLGQYNDTLVSNDPSSFVGTNYALVIGNGTGLSNRSNALEVYKNGNTVINGALSLQSNLTLKNSSEIIVSDNQLVTVASRGYIRISANAPNIAVMRTVNLSNGTAPGQILFLECSGSAWELLDSGSANLASDKTFNNQDIIQLMWNGGKWLEIHFSDN